MSYLQNKDIITQISEFVALNTKDYFQDQIKNKLSKQFSDLIKINNLSFIDKYGRATFFYIELDDTRIPFYQPGTFCFQSGIKSEFSSMTVCHDGCQQNGSILGTGCALFIARFMATLAQNYIRMKNESDQTQFDFEIYKTALLATLNSLSPEDATQHGRLLEMKDWLLNFTSKQIQLQVYEEVFFYLKELQEKEKIQDFSESEINSAKFALSAEELKKLQQNKNSARIFSSFDKYFRDYTNQSLFYSEQFQELKNYLLSKKGITSDNEKFSEQLTQFLQTVKEVKNFLVTETSASRIQQNTGAGAAKGGLSLVSNYNEDFISSNGRQEMTSESNNQQQFQQQQQFEETFSSCCILEDFQIPEDFFANKSVPKYLKRGYEEKQVEHAQRVLNFLKIMSKQELVYILTQIDPARKDMSQLLKVTNIVLSDIVKKSN